MSTPRSVVLAFLLTAGAAVLVFALATGHLEWLDPAARYLTAVVAAALLVSSGNRPVGRGRRR